MCAPVPGGVSPRPAPLLRSEYQTVTKPYVGRYGRVVTQLGDRTRVWVCRDCLKRWDYGTYLAADREA